MNRRIKRFFRSIKADLIRIAIYGIMFFLVALAICFIVSIPEIIGCLIFG